jgi:DNA repair protein RadC
MLTTKQTPIARILITKGTATASLAHPREIFKPAILANAVSILLAHNHPSGMPEPSGADIALTRQVRDAGKVLGIELLDHLILGDKDTDPTGKGFYSFRTAGLL